MIKLKDDNDDAVLRELRDDEMLADASGLADLTRSEIVKAPWKSASMWQALANKIGECEVVTVDGIVKGVIWPERSLALNRDKKVTKPTLLGSPNSPASCT